MWRCCVSRGLSKAKAAAAAAFRRFSSSSSYTVVDHMYDAVVVGARGVGLRALKYFSSDVEVLPLVAGELNELGSLQVKVSAPRVSEAPLCRMQALKELELSMVPPSPSTLSIPAEVARLKCPTKLTICHFSIRYLPPEVGSHRKLQELDLSFNKLKILPNCRSELGALKFLKVTNNKLVDLLPGISYLRCLESLDVSKQPIDFPWIS